ncbi:1D-myo-inositol 2-acetamido-2-deoxy-alpha-D-glucopyranoside deacetylase [Xanthomonas hydrangeae]|nr:1D-myo-inositol 2-acetamido-2-deoxy-alpha-D-glucopyranoside deacetylase [Xanthomonas hydrangeae]CAD7735439.1 1D-myo-inositol 2-acetamido-2-deoxy-alpha-D-glucopyranoside deacetylase [Xanthomonas hydrangeae]CAD7744447.1 1D-myo-inositol 2-acetamido-2-deoxy-alpha-D-glucopyranoside deacetylase [Xanthomonas hydrangeae]CAD7744450.1 1D-myo-inositol 2-acetamido-2-deoxy-alpha-D-glucopyranoside deacetylase [Xanthomonas hydrangeae]
MEDLTGQPIEGAGTPESVWRDAACLSGMPRSSLSQLLQGSPRLVVVAPHPDDEVLGCGGLIAAARAAGVSVLIIALTDGELAYPDEPGWAPHVLGPARRLELDAAVRHLGLLPGALIHLALGDGALAACEARIADVVGGLLDANDTVLVTWQRDGHPDHEAASRATRAACDTRGARLLQYPVWAWHWSQPDDGVFTDEHATRFELSPTVMEAKRQAIQCFATQIGQCTPAVAAPILPLHVLERFDRSFEVFIR